MRRRNRKAVEEDFLGFLGNRNAVEENQIEQRKSDFWAKKISIFPTTFSSFWQFWGLVLTPNLLPCARMDLLDMFVGFQLLII